MNNTYTTDDVKNMEEKAEWLPDDEKQPETTVTVEKKPDEVKISWETEQK